VATAQFAAAQGLDVVVLGPSPEYALPLPILVAKSLVSGGQSPADYLVRSRSDVDRKIKEVLQASGVSYFSVLDALCSPECLATTPAGEPAQFDYGHFTIDGARTVARRIQRKCPFRVGCGN
jgi:hypothetical protein